MVPGLDNVRALDFNVSLHTEMCCVDEMPKSSVLAVLMFLLIPVNISEVKLCSVFLAETRIWKILVSGGLVLYPSRGHWGLHYMPSCFSSLPHQPACLHTS